MALELEMRDRVAESHEGKKVNESQQAVHQINWQRSRYVYDLYYEDERIDKSVYDYCVETKQVDALLMAKWKKSGYENLCSTYAINSRNFKFGTVSMCRVPEKSLGEGVQVKDPITGCLGCASGNKNTNIFGNKYGQRLSWVQLYREGLAYSRQESAGEQESGTDPDSVWASEEEYALVMLDGVELEADAEASEAQEQEQEQEVVNASKRQRRSE